MGLVFAEALVNSHLPLALQGLEQGEEATPNFDENELPAHALG